MINHTCLSPLRKELSPSMADAPMAESFMLLLIVFRNGDKYPPLAFVFLFFESMICASSQLSGVI